MINFLITTKKLSIEFTLKKMRRESKCVTPQKTLKETVMEKMRDKK